MSTAKLELFRFTLNHKSEGFKTFRQFMLETGKCNNKNTDAQIFGKLYKYFMEKPNKDFVKNESMKKTMTVINKKKNGVNINKYIDLKPEPKLSHYTIDGVVNGGAFGIDRLLSDTNDKDKTDSLIATQTVLEYYYIFVYFPLDHNEGFFMVQSDKEGTITAFLRDYIASLFKSGDYLKPKICRYAPMNIQEEFRNQAVVSSLTFTNRITDIEYENEENERIEFPEYDVVITIKPKSEISLSTVERLKNFIGSKIFGSKTVTYKLREFDKCSFSAKDTENKVSKTFEWNTREEEFAPVIYLDGKVRMTENDTPDYADVRRYCMELFNDTIKPELRLDLDVNGMA